MAVRTAYVATQASGDVLTSANFSKLPGGWIGYAEVTANQTLTTAVTDLTSLSVTVTVNTSRRILITGYGLFDNNEATPNFITLYIRESGTTLSLSQQFLNTSGSSGESSTTTCQVVLTPSSGAHTYKLSAAFAAGTTSILAATATFPAFILVEDIGPSA